MRRRAAPILGSGIASGKGTPHDGTKTHRDRFHLRGRGRLVDGAGGIGRLPHQQHRRCSRRACRGALGRTADPAGPAFSYATTGKIGTLDLVGSDITADFKLDQRRKGLLWYATYAVDFRAAYRVKNALSKATSATFSAGVSDNRGRVRRVRGKRGWQARRRDVRQRRSHRDIPDSCGATALVKTGYRTQGLDSWRYLPTRTASGS